MYSVIIPTFNRECYVVEAIESVLQQGYDDIEIIVVDDGSTDQTAHAITRFGDKVRYYFQDNKGPASARNTGIMHAKGNLIAFLDSDDIWLPGKIQKELDLFQQYPDVDMIAGNAESYREEVLHTASVFDSRNIIFEGMNPRYFCWSFSIMPLGPACITSSMIVKRAALEQLGHPVFDKNLRFDEDWDLEFRIFSQYKVLFFREVLTKIRAYNDGTRLSYSFPGVHKTAGEKRMIWKTQIKIIERYLGKINWGVHAEYRFSQRRGELLKLLENI